MTGLSGSGKTTLSRVVAEKLKNRGIPVEIVDGDEYRENLCSDLGFSKKDRNTNIRRLSFVASRLAKQGVVSIMATINPYDDIRKEVAEKGGILVYVKCSISTLKKRDPKGLYKRANLPNGHPDKIENFTGISDPFEEPSDPILVINTDTKDINFSANLLEQFILDRLQASPKYGKLKIVKTFIKKIGNRNRKYCVCVCDCGKEKIVSLGNLISGNVTTCGDRVCNGKAIDLSNKKFGRLCVTSNHKHITGKGFCWECVCDCGNVLWVRSGCLISGNTKSCGCLKVERQSKDFGQATRETVYRRYKRIAKKKNLDFTISEEEFLELTQSKCYYCGCLPASTQKSLHKNGDFVYNGIDRVDNTKGYVLSNCVSCCYVCNYMKKDMPCADFFNKITEIYETRIKNGKTYKFP